MPELQNVMALMSQERQDPSRINKALLGGYECLGCTDLWNPDGLDGSGEPVV